MRVLYILLYGGEREPLCAHCARRHESYRPAGGVAEESTARDTPMAESGVPHLTGCQLQRSTSSRSPSGFGLVDIKSQRDTHFSLLLGQACLS